MNIGIDDCDIVDYGVVVVMEDFKFVVENDIVVVIEEVVVFIIVFR